jgi:hypothetical protein
MFVSPLFTFPVLSSQQRCSRTEASLADYRLKVGVKFLLEVQLVLPRGIRSFVAAAADEAAAEATYTLSLYSDSGEKLISPSLDRFSDAPPTQFCALVLIQNTLNTRHSRNTGKP